MANAKRVCFLSIAQHPQVWHSLSVTVGVTGSWPDMGAKVAAIADRLERAQ